MIARRWIGRVPAERRDAYIEYLRTTGFPDYAATQGHRATLALHRTQDGVTTFELTTLWESLEAIRAFAGEDISLARYYPEDPQFLLELPERVEHWDVVDAVTAGPALGPD
jgi:hypothetical protein